MRVCVLCCYAGATSSMCVCAWIDIKSSPSLLREMTKLAPSSLSLRDTRTHTRNPINDDTEPRNQAEMDRLCASLVPATTTTTAQKEE